MCIGSYILSNLKTTYTGVGGGEWWVGYTFYKDTGSSAVSLLVKEMIAIHSIGQDGH